MANRSSTKLALVAACGVVLLSGVGWGLASYLNRKSSLVQARTLLAAGDWARAEVELKKYLAGGARAAQTNEAKLLLAQVLARLEKHGESLELLESIPDTAPEAPRARVAQGNHYWDRAGWLKAESLWKRALQLDPRVPEAGWWLLDLYFMHGRFQEAEQLALQLYDTEPDSRDRIGLLWELVRQDNERMDPSTVKGRMEDALREHPDDFHSQLALARSYGGSGQIEKALNLVQQLASAHVSSVEVWETWLWCLYESGNFAEIRQLLESLSPEISSDRRVQKYHAAALEDAGDWSAAREIYEKRLQGDPYDRKAHYRLSRVLRGLGQEQQADWHEQRSRQLDAARENLARLYASRSGALVTGDLCAQAADYCEALGRREQALRWFQEALRREPTHKAAAAGLARLTDSAP
ncbi:MAG: tetratricopeptide repeat protein [Planctomycetes bacterium]|nr:tetratricopeptide repeat protein [Planctomycetota bacterium]